MQSRRWHSLGKYLLAVVCGYALFLVLVALGRADVDRRVNSASDEDDPHPRERDEIQRDKMELLDVTHAASRDSVGAVGQVYHDCISEIHLAVICLGSDDVTDMSLMLKTLLYHRRDAITLHVVADDRLQRIVKRLFVTWELPKVDLQYYRPPASLMQDAKSPIPREAFVMLLPYILPVNLNKVIVVDPRMRFMEDVGHLWRHLESYGEYEIFGIPRHPSVNDPQGRTRFMLEIVTVHLRKAKTFYQMTGNTLEHLARFFSTSKNVEVFLNDKLPSKAIVDVACAWNVHLLQGFDLKKCFADKNIAKAVVWGNAAHTFTSFESFELQREELLSVVELDAEIYRHKLPVHCTTPARPASISIHPSNDTCAPYRHASHLRRRTHLYYVDLSGGALRATAATSGDPHDVTVMTQMTVDRFEVFERIVENFLGPMIVVVHGRDVDAVNLRQRISRSKVLKKRTNISFHFVYRRERYYPINYLRNVAMEECHTPYCLFLDVDLVPNPDLYPVLKAAIKEHLKGTSLTALVVPAFEALQELPQFPSNRTELLALMDQKKLVGYRMNRGWNLGHKPTNYTAWRKATKPYQAQWADAFEPYVVLPAASGVRYDERLLERMGDKIAFGREVYARGYQFLVLHDAFVVHLPHPTSDGTLLWLSDGNYLRCGGALFKEFARDLKQKFPDRKFL